MSADRLGRSLGPYKSAFLALGVCPTKFDTYDIRIIARRIRQAEVVFKLE